MTAPTPQFRQHHAVDAPRVDAGAFRPAWRVRTRLDQLMLDRTITPLEWMIAIRFRSMAEIVAQRESVRVARTEFVPRGVTLAPIINTKASRYCRDIRERCGSTGYGILIACIVDDLSWTELGRRLGVDRRTARAWAIVLIHLLGKKTP